MARHRARYTIDPQLPMLLEDSHPARCERAFHAVDSDGIQTQCLESDL
jgi:hypothetical protein